MYCGDDVSSIVFDIGSFNVRAGYSGEDCPRIVIPSQVGVLPEVDVDGDHAMANGDNHQIHSQEKSKKERIISGQTELGCRQSGLEIMNIYNDDGSLRLNVLDSIIQNQLVKNLNIQLTETPILFTESAIHNKEFRMKLTEYMFEKYKIPALFLVKDPVLTSFSFGRSSALVLDCGHSQTVASPVNDGYSLLKCLIKHDIAGKHITKDLLHFLKTTKKIDVKPRFTFKKKFMNVDGNEVVQLYDLSNTEEVQDTTQSFYDYSVSEIVRDIKEEFLNVSDEVLQFKVSDQSRIGQYELPDGQKILMTDFERKSFCEKLFQNSSSIPNPDDKAEQQLTQTDISGFAGVQNMIVESIQKSDIDIRRELFSNIILTGGTTMMKGFSERIQKHLPDISPQNIRVKVLSSNERRFQPWVGGSILSSLGSFQQMWMSRYEYEEHGSIMIERKCP